MKSTRRMKLSLFRQRKWVLFATMTMGTTFQVTACREETALFGLRWAISSVTLPINQFIRDLLLGFGAVI